MKPIAVIIAALLTTFSGVALADSSRTITKLTFGCTTKERFSKNVALQHDDPAAFRKAIVRDLENGSCVGFEAGQRVFLEETAFTDGLKKVRPAGDDESYWTFWELVK